MEHLVKRNPKLSDPGVLKPAHLTDVFTESSVNRRPSGWKAKKGEIVWVAEVGYGIYARGEISADPRLLRFSSINELLDRRDEIPVRDDRYILRLIIKIHRAKAFKFLSLLIVEVEVEDIAGVIEIPQGFRTQTAWLYVEPGDIVEASSQNSPYLTDKIPGAVRLRVYQQLARAADRHIIDIDHFVPRSVGGPGNLEENLVPVSFRLNRAKSDRIPRGLFVESSHHDELCNLLPADWESGDSFLSGARYRDAAKKIVAVVKSWPDLETIKAFYAAVKAHHFDRTSDPSTLAECSYQEKI